MAKISAQRAKADLESKKDLEEVLKNLEDLSCKYLGVDCNGAPDLAAKAKTRSLLYFAWHVRIFEYSESHALTTRCDNACNQGVAFPEHWKTALRCVGLAKKAAAATAAARISSSNEHVECSLLGLPKPASVPIAGTAGAPGSVLRGGSTDGERLASGLPLVEPVRRRSLVLP